MSVVSIRFQENLHLKVAQLETLYEDLGTQQAEELICRSFERLSVHVQELDALWVDSTSADFQRVLHGMISVAQDMGLFEMADLAVNVLDCRQSCDFVATAATLMRLRRVSVPFLSSDPLQHTMLI